MVPLDNLDSSSTLVAFPSQLDSASFCFPHILTILQLLPDSEKLQEEIVVAYGKRDFTALKALGWNDGGQREMTALTRESGLAHALADRMRARLTKMSRAVSSDCVLRFLRVLSVSWLTLRKQILFLSC